MARLLSFSLALLVAVYGSAAGAGDEDPFPYLEDLPLEIREGGEWDPEDAPLPLLSRDPAVGRWGARRIGEARRALSPPELRRLWWEIRGSPGGRWGGLLLNGKGSGSLLLRERQLLSSAGLRRIDLLQWERGELGARIAAERDPGERRWNDFFSWSATWNSPSDAVRVVAGDMAVRLGSGLLVGTSTPYGPPSPTGSFRASRLGLYGSRLESDAHHGVGALFPALGGRWIILVTSTRRDARVDDEGRVSSIDRSGLHRTPSEEGRRDRLHERIGALRYETGRGALSLGVTGAAAGFHPSLGGGDLRRKPKAFQGDRLGAWAFEFRWREGWYDVAGEVGASTTGGAAGRLLLRLSSGRTRFSFRFRNFSGRFHAPRGTVYHRIGGEPSGEIGAIFGGRTVVGGRVKMEGRLHLYSSFDRTYQSAGPVAGREMEVRWELLRRRLSPYLRIRRAAKVEGPLDERRRSSSQALSLGVEAKRGASRLRLDGKWKGDVSCTGEREGSAALALLVSTDAERWGRLALSIIRVRDGGLPLLLPAASLPRTASVEWFGGGRGKGGLFFAWSRPLGRIAEAALSAGPGTAAFEISLQVF